MGHRHLLATSFFHQYETWPSLAGGCCGVNMIRSHGGSGMSKYYCEKDKRRFSLLQFKRNKLEEKKQV